MNITPVNYNQNQAKAQISQPNFGAGIYKAPKALMEKEFGPIIADQIEQVIPQLKKLAQTPIKNLPEGIAIVLSPNRDSHALDVIIRDDFPNNAKWKEIVENNPILKKYHSGMNEEDKWRNMSGTSAEGKGCEYGTMYLNMYNPKKFRKSLVAIVREYIGNYPKTMEDAIKRNNERYHSN